MAGIEATEKARIRRGRLAELYLRHGPWALRLAYLLTGDRMQAEDLVQEAFVRLAGRFADLRDAGAFQAYLRKTVVNLARMHWRRRRVERAYLERERGFPRAPVELPDVADHEQMKQALLALPQRQRAAVVLRFYEDLSEAQIAEIMGCRPGTVKSLLSHGLHSLRAQIRGE